MGGFGKKRSRKKGKSKIIAHKTTVDGILFQSKLEAYTYQALKAANIPALYEGKIFTLQKAFTPASESWEWKYKKYKPRRSTMASITYKPDFTCPLLSWVIECKGRANESFPLRWKMFKNHLREEGLKPMIFLPHSREDVDKTITEILRRQE